MVVEFNHLLPATPELGMGLSNDYLVGTKSCTRNNCWNEPADCSNEPLTSGNATRNHISVREYR